MDLYLVRHGATAANERHVYQPPTEPISAIGAAEVTRLVRHIQELTPTHIYTSEFKRARETAHYFGYATGLEPEWLPDLHEIRAPEQMFGRSHYGLASFQYQLRWFFGLYTPAPGSKAETKEAFVHRVLRTRAHFEAHHAPEDRVVAVTHSIFINFFVAHLCQDAHISLFQAVPLLLKIFAYENSGITHLRYDHNEAREACRWQVVSYNDHAHLSV